MNNVFINMSWAFKTFKMSCWVHIGNWKGGGKIWEMVMSFLVEVIELKVVWQYQMWVFKRGIQNKKGVWLQTNVLLKGNYSILIIGVQFSTSTIIRIFFVLFCFYWKIWITHYLLLTFLMASIFESLLLLKWCPIFDISPLHQF